MANPLTGDFEAVLEVSGGTLNRLLASLHQNGGVDPAFPSLPHLARLRIGDPTPLDGMRGSVAAQISVPHLELIHGSTDRFWLEVGVRAQYRPDAGSVRLPEIVHGTVRAQYRLDGVDPACRGWRTLAADHVWVRVVDDTVSFTGTAYDQADPWSVITAVDEPAALARVTRLLTVLLKTQFEAAPHRVSRRFQRGAMRSLAAGGASGVVLPLGLDGDPVPGRIDSLTSLALGGRDLALAISAEAILARVRPILDDFKAAFNLVYRFRFKLNVDAGIFDVDVVTIDITWRITIASATVSWTGGVIPLLGFSAGLLTVTVAGQARTQKPQYNWDFTATILILVNFDAAREGFTFTPVGTPTVAITGPFAPTVRAQAQAEVEKQIRGQVAGIVGRFAGTLDIGVRKDDLVRQLQTLDPLAQVSFDEAVSSPDGVVARGRIALSPRRGPVHHLAQAGADAFTALESWIPGGRIDSHRWSWQWFNAGGPPGAATGTDSFLLRRPRATQLGKFGASVGLRQPLPGLDGSGRVCLEVVGHRVDAVSGALVPVTTGRRCKRYGIDLRLVGTAIDPIFIQEWVPGPRDPLGPVTEVGLVVPAAEAPGTNLLVLHAGERWRPELGETLERGLDAVRRRDAGLQVVILFREGALGGPDVAFIADIQALGARLDASLLLQEDVRGSWARALDVTGGEPEWRLTSPTGGVLWSHTGRLDPGELAEALDDRLFPSQPASPTEVTLPLRIGSRIAVGALEFDPHGVVEQVERPCPAPPFSRLGIAAVVGFVQKGSQSSDVVIRQIAATYDGDDRTSLVALVVGGARADEIDAVQAGLPDGVLVVPDPDGALARRAGVRAWPTRIDIDDLGVITSIETGSAAGDPDSSVEQGS